jgi:hypothetical protein
LSVPQKLAVRFTIYLAVMAYLFCDLRFDGPLSRSFGAKDYLSEDAIAEAKAMGIVARVYYQPIYRTQVENRVKEYLWKRGRRLEEPSKQEREMLGEIALQQLIDELLMKIQVKISPVGQFDPTSEELHEAVRRFRNRYSKEEFAELINSQGWRAEGETELRIKGRLQREVYLQEYIELEVTDEEVRGWYDSHRGKYAAPARRKIKQFFRTSYGENGQNAEKEVRQASEKNDWEPTMTGWVVAERLPKDMALAVFGLPLNEATIFQSKLGWHLVEVMAEEAEADAPFEEVKEVIRQAMYQERKKSAYHYFHRLLRLRAEGKIEVFDELLTSQPAK